jgi:hypothetical protein
MNPFLFVMAHSFSGSTLLSFLLGAHPDVATVGEMFIAEGVDPETYVCSCGEPIAECGFWREVSRRMAARGISYDVRRRSDTSFSANGAGRIPHLLLAAEPRGPVLETVRTAGLALVPEARRTLESRLRTNRALAEVITEIRGARAFADASKRPGRALHLRRLPDLDLRVLHLVRDGRAVSRSCMRNLGYTPEAAARSWAGSARDAERLRERFSGVSEDRWMTLRYEDLCRDPDTALDRLFRFVGVDPSRRAPDFRAVDHHIIGNRMRLSHASEIRLDERWRTDVPPDQLQTVERIAGPELRRHGYA